MGLSIEERIRGMYNCIEFMVKSGRGINPTSRFSYDNNAVKRLHEICSAAHVWHAFLGGTSNGMHWIMGSDSANVITTEASSPWAMAVKETIATAHARNKPSPMDDVDNRFDAFRHSLGISALLGQWDATGKAVYEVFQATESMVYYLRRYHDDFMTQNAAMSALISEVQGLCFEVFQDRHFAMAYLMYQMCDVVYADHLYFINPDTQDWVTRWLVKNNMHHHMCRPMSDGWDNNTFEVIIKTHKEMFKKFNELEGYPYQKFEKFQFERVCVALILSGRRFHYAHQHKELLAACRANGFTDEQVKTVEGYCKFCTSADTKRAARSREDYRNPDKELEVHGFGNY